MTHFRAALAAVMLAITGCAVGSPDCYERSAIRNELRIVPQLGIGDAPFFRIAPGERFAIFSIGAVDLWNARVAWVEAWTPWRVQTPPHVIVIEAQQDIGMRLFDLRSGSGSEFLGERLPHHDLGPSIVALQRSSSVVLVDTLQAREVQTLPISRRVLSAVRGRSEIYLLVQVDTPADSHSRRFAVLRFDTTSGTMREERAVSLENASLERPPDTHWSEPFLVFDADVGIQVSLAAGCPLCPEGEASPLRWYRRALTDSGPWNVSVIDLDDATTLDRLPRNSVPRRPPSTPLPVREVLERLPSADLGWLKTGRDSPNFTTGDATRDCTWSLVEARRQKCVSTQAREPLALSSGLATCRLRVEAFDPTGPPGGIPITCDDRLLVTAYDLGARDWALVLPDGRFTGTDMAMRYLAFYRRDGSLLNSDEMQQLRLSASEASRRLLSALQRAPRAQRWCPSTVE